jgi:hypothetical protein
LIFYLRENIVVITRWKILSHLETTGERRNVYASEHKKDASIGQKHGAVRQDGDLNFKDRTPYGLATILDQQHELQ